ncbi:MAG: hypothetical protein IFK94_11155 [Acidobacteria bacterium]|uniref:Phosphate/phosphite/phosphonate ABC transporter substrate-binding protein n=1 Tax=Candidatus Polarisedimenticola svalbardensis TaxID=2886004 RepID=A0A8J6Y1V7_9BACT|nr:hypothetical protein [Candidatus Polarisedimenticola svalbardensis]
MFRTALILMLCLVPAVPAASQDCLVFCAPGYPGTTDEAQPTMDRFAGGLAAAAGWEPGGLAAVYYPSGPAGLERLQTPDVVLAMVTLPFYLKHGETLKLDPVLAAVAAGEGDGAWSLVAARDRLKQPGDLSGWTVTGLPAYHPGLVRGPVLSGWGDLPEDTELKFTSRVLSSLRKASRGENLAVLLDKTQVEALPSLPYAESLEVVYRSGPMPTSLLCVVDGRLPEERRTGLIRSLPGLEDSAAGAALLETIRLERFVALDRAALQRIAGASD